MLNLNRINARIRDEINAWWEAHPEIRVEKPHPTAASLALSVVHWHHNVESARRYRPDTADNDQGFLRLYAVSATRAWLNEAQDDIDNMVANDCVDWYRRRDLESLIRNLQRSLDDFQHNGPAIE